MHGALFQAKHNASLSTMQPAYDAQMAEDADTSEWRAIRETRRQRLLQLLEQAGGPKKLAEKADATDTHLTACAKGRRAIGDELANALERGMKKPRDWMDQPIAAPAPHMDAQQIIKALSEMLASTDRSLLDELSSSFGAFVKSGGAERHHAAILDILGARLGESIPATGTHGR